jgi:hypothetical protein
MFLEKDLLNLAPQESVLPWKRCHNSPSLSFRTSPPQAGEIRNPVKALYNEIITGSRLASRFAGLGRDDEVRHSLLTVGGHLVIVRS